MCDYEIKNHNLVLLNKHITKMLIGWLFYFIGGHVHLNIFWIEYFGTNSHCCGKKSLKSGIIYLFILVGCYNFKSSLK